MECLNKNILEKDIFIGLLCYVTGGMFKEMKLSSGLSVVRKWSIFMIGALPCLGCYNKLS